MSQYLSKEEIKQWRSSLEKITLEEYAKKLGKVLEEDKKTSDIIDIVMQNEKRLYTTKETNNNNVILKVAKKSLDKQREIEKTTNNTSIKEIKSKLSFKKNLTEREDTVLCHFIKNQGQIVYARDLATILDLPCDYVYKYIKNLRAKINKDVIQNATKGGYIFELN